MNRSPYQTLTGENLMPINLGKAAQDLRDRLGLSLRDAALELGVSYPHLCNVENGKASPSPEIIEKFHEAWGIDLYMFALAFHSDDRETPKALRGPVKAMAAGWKQHIELLLRRRSKEGVKPCLTSAD
jgi:transcriptional regulator with XRE-family HTH domain